LEVIATFENLKAEMARAGIGPTEMAPLMEISKSSLVKKLAGDIDFKLREMRLGQTVLTARIKTPPNALTLDYLFGEEGDR
jgi:hypothetical protein